MARILHLEGNPTIRKRIRRILESAGHTVASARTIDEAKSCGEQSLYVCGPLNKHSDGLGFAIDKISEGSKVLVVAPKRKFSRIPFLSTYALRDRKLVQKVVHELLAGD